VTKIDLKELKGLVKRSFTPGYHDVLLRLINVIERQQEGLEDSHDLFCPRTFRSDESFTYKDCAGICRACEVLDDVEDMMEYSEFSLTNLVHEGHLQQGQTLYFVSGMGQKRCTIEEQGKDYQLIDGAGMAVSAQAFVTECMGTDPVDHPTKWIRTEDGKLLFDLWHEYDQRKII